jgi:ppGpp synthetase/RelA/SpoT-type nucleotidyltranferase
VHRVDHSYEVRDRVFLRVKPHKSLIKFGKGSKLSPRFMGPSEIVEKKRPMAYRLSFPNYLRHMHDVFHVYVLRHYVSDPTHVIDLISLQVSYEGDLMEEPIHILDNRI